MPKRITDDVRWMVITKWLCGCSLNDTANHPMIKEWTISKICCIYHENGTVNLLLDLKGRNQKFDNDDLTYLCCQNPDWYLEEFQAAMEEFLRCSISKSTIWH